MSPRSFLGGSVGDNAVLFSTPTMKGATNLKLSNVVIENNDTERRFETTFDGHLAFLSYDRFADTIVMIHTEVPEPIGGRGIAGQLAQAAVAYALDHQLTVIPLCPFVIDYLKRHQEYLPLIASNYKAGVTAQPPTNP
jgi:predicted GNAT family acetyltransferase